MSESDISTTNNNDNSNDLFNIQPELLTEKDLIEGKYYLNVQHGICKFKCRTIFDGKEVLQFTFAKYHGITQTLLIDEKDLIYFRNFTNPSGKPIMLSSLGSNKDWRIEMRVKLKIMEEELKKNKVRLGKTQALAKTKKSLSDIETYKNILIDGLNSIENLLEKYLKIITTNNKEFEDLILDILDNSTYPHEYKKEIDVQYEDNSKLAIINYKMPNTLEIPKIIKYKYDELFDRLTETEMKVKDFNMYYESILFQITLRTIKEVFITTDNDKIESVVFNGMVECTDRRTGNNFSSCIISVMTARKDFEEINLAQVSPKDCVLYLKGIFSGSLHQLAPVKPILDINKDDKRFVNSKEVLSQLDDGVNLAEMDWEDFEHLVRELFEKMFSSDGSEVKVTQASRDGGVDAVAFDTDPIKGGKFIIQAKRYNNVVPVSAIRDLYGTVINEGAIKGILVTTSYFGNDSREFSKDKPITLIDGSNIVYLLNKYGYKTHIELKKK